MAANSSLNLCFKLEFLLLIKRLLFRDEEHLRRLLLLVDLLFAALRREGAFRSTHGLESPIQASRAGMVAARKGHSVKYAGFLSAYGTFLPHLDFPHGVTSCSR